MRQLFGILSLMIALSALTNPVGAQSIESGVWGGACLSGDVPCSQGVCDRSLGLCVPCGMSGQAACRTADGKFSCSLTSWGETPVATTGGKMICLTATSTDCGQIGSAACLRNGKPYCYYGTVVTSSITKVAAYCASCGDFGQACCVDTAYICDYGVCENGKCLPPQNATRDQIIAAIDDCRLKDARGLIDALPTGTTFIDEVRDLLGKAKKREDQVRALFKVAKETARTAKRQYFSEDYGNSALTFYETMAQLQKARNLTQCPSIRTVLDEGIAMTQRNIDRSQTEVLLNTAESAITLCLFDLARQELDKISTPNEKYDALVQRLNEAEATKTRVVSVYNKGKKLNIKGKKQLGNKQFTAALASFTAAHEMISRARQLTNCAETRDVIDEALAAVGRNIMRADNSQWQTTVQQQTKSQKQNNKNQQFQSIPLTSSTASTGKGLPCPKNTKRCIHLFMKGSLNVTKSELSELDACRKRSEKIKACNEPNLNK